MLFLKKYLFYKISIASSCYAANSSHNSNNIGGTKISKKDNSRLGRILLMPAFTVVIYKQKPFLEI